MLVLTILILIVFAVLLELSKNTLAGWILGIVLACAYLLLRRVGNGRGIWNRKIGAASFLIFLVLLCAAYVLTQPPLRRVLAVEASHPEVTAPVQVAQGELTGVYNQDHSVRVYAGIPYAKPPVGELRWREPQEAEPWEGVRSCDAFGPMAMQQRSSELFNSITRILGFHDYRISLKDNFREAMSEDCLYLNVFAPEKAGDGTLPVLFYVHGGSLMTGQSSYSEYRGEDLAKRGIIVVNFAYRLGVFGYYANEELEAESQNGTTGNYGLLDQIAALRWVHENIAAFGGDPEQITIAGESAGASSVNALCVSPLTKGLFVRAIAESSGIVAKTPYHTFRTREDALGMGKDILAEMGAEDVAALRQVRAEKLVQTQYANSAMMVDGYAIREQPYLTYEKGENHEQALLNGFNAKEADAFLLNAKATAENYESLLAPILGSYAKEAAQLVPPGSVQRDQRFVIDAGGDAKGSLDHVYSAAWFTWSHELWSSYVAAQERPVYEYYFTKTNRSLSNFHAGELPYAYGNLWRHPGLYDDGDRALSEIMQTYWVNFVKTGDPNTSGLKGDKEEQDPKTLPKWSRRTESERQLLILGDDVLMAEDPYQELYALLENYQDQQSR